MRGLQLSDIKKLSVQEIVKQNPYKFHANEYPHKICYQNFAVPFNLTNLWDSEDIRHLFLYIDIPFYDQRRNFSDLFNFNINNSEQMKPYIESMEKQAKTVLQHIRSNKYKPFHLDHVTIGGGNPSILDRDQLNRTLDIVEVIFQSPITLSKLTMELYPTYSEDFLEILMERSIYRIQVSVQSFLERDLKRLGVSTSSEKIHEKVELISSMGFPQFSVDLIYGIEDQSVKNFLTSIEHIINYEPDEIFLNPLYIMPAASNGIGEDYTLTQNQDIRSNLYDKGRQRLVEAGFYQDSMRRFVKNRSMRVKTTIDPQKYNFIKQNSIGIGYGATSCTKNVHYSEPHAESQKDINTSIHNYIEKNLADFSTAPYGFQLDDEEQKRRLILKSLLWYKGLDTEDYRREFGVEPQKDFPVLLELVDFELVHKNGSFLALTDTGMGLSDSIEPLLYSINIIKLMEEFALRF